MTKQHDNDFTFNFPGLTQVGFQERDHSISSGQPYGGVSIKNNNTVTIKAGRHKTSQVAHWFDDVVQGGGGIALTYSDTSPEELNFAVRGTLTLVINNVTYTAQNFVLAQGSTTTGGNNWWLGSAQMSGIKHSDVTLDYATAIVKATLGYVTDIVTEDPVGAIEDTAKLIVAAVQKHKVGSGEVPFTLSTSNNAVELLLFQVSENHDTEGSLLTGTYTAP
ncbi:hypothetical protein IGB42_01592 [Andreprevotia sp. IGB-42]|uniref:flagellin n=1 Tax=Andreprevotia sp. IGB-42 TaxID=2497473 RepID=UPI0013593615|nr:flagellin [Andreprevotia sp. IGB-42]KAF0813913.1 hypothetical protein IGB42_01592 [Andreprevotia sp. IGB-42]